MSFSAARLKTKTSPALSTATMASWVEFKMNSSNLALALSIGYTPKGYFNAPVAVILFLGSSS
jgi:hypothetical protein